MTHAARALIDRCFAGTLAPADWDELFAHLRGCTGCHDHFQRTRAAFRALGGGTGPAPALARPEADLIRDLLLPPEPRPRWRWAPVAALALAGALVVLLLVRPRGDTTDGFAERGAVAARAGFEVLCVPPQESAEPISASAAGGRCAPGSFLKAVVTRPDPALPHVTVVALDAGFAVRATLRAQTSGAGPVFLQGHTRLQAGDALVVVALFAGQPVPDATVAQAVERARRAGAALKDLSGLAVPDTAQILVRVQAPEARDAR